MDNSSSSWAAGDGSGRRGGSAARSSGGSTSGGNNSNRRRSSSRTRGGGGGASVAQAPNNNSGTAMTRRASEATAVLRKSASSGGGDRDRSSGNRSSSNRSSSRSRASARGKSPQPPLPPHSSFTASGGRGGGDNTMPAGVQRQQPQMQPPSQGGGHQQVAPAPQYTRGRHNRPWEEDSSEGVRTAVVARSRSSSSRDVVVGGSGAHRSGNPGAMQHQQQSTMSSNAVPAVPMQHQQQQHVGRGQLISSGTTTAPTHDGSSSSNSGRPRSRPRSLQRQKSSSRNSSGRSKSTSSGTSPPPPPSSRRNRSVESLTISPQPPPPSNEAAPSSSSSSYARYLASRNPQQQQQQGQAQQQQQTTTISPSSSSNKPGLTRAQEEILARLVQKTKNIGTGGSNSTSSATTTTAASSALTGGGATTTTTKLTAEQERTLQRLTSNKRLLNASSATARRNSGGPMPSPRSSSPRNTINSSAQQRRSSANAPTADATSSNTALRGAAASSSVVAPPLPQAPLAPSGAPLPPPAPGAAPQQQQQPVRRRLSGSGAATTSAAAVLLGRAGSMEDDTSSTNSATKELRAKRLLQQRQQQQQQQPDNTSGGTTKTRAQGPLAAPQPLPESPAQQHHHHHFPASSPEVEQYLARKQQQQQQQGGGLSTSTSAATQKQPQTPTESTPAASSASEQSQPQPADETARNTHEATRGWSTLNNKVKLQEQHQQRQKSQQPSPAVATATSSSPSSPQEKNKVEEYLARRSSSTTGNTTATTAASPAAGTTTASPPKLQASSSLKSSNLAKAALQAAWQGASVATQNPILTVNNKGISIGQQQQQQQQQLDDPIARLQQKQQQQAQQQQEKVSDASIKDPEQKQGVVARSTTEKDAASTCSSDEEDVEEVVMASGSSSKQEWSVRVTVVSAVDFPASVVPNVPFSPVLHVGLVKLPKVNNNADATTVDTSTREDRNAALARACAERLDAAGGLKHWKQARVRCTSTKVLSKRDAGSAEFHEEMRWDGVVHPAEHGVVLELQAAAVMTPTNIRESPPAVVPASTAPGVGGGGRMSPPNGMTSPPPTKPSTVAERLRSDATDSSTTSSSGGSGLASGLVGSLFRGRGMTGGSIPGIPGSADKRKSGEMETAHAAAAVAKLLVQGEGKGDKTAQAAATATPEQAPQGPLFDSKATSSSSMVSTLVHPAAHETNVQLRKRRRQQRNSSSEQGNNKQPKMTADIRLGSCMIPLDQLALHKVLQEKRSNKKKPRETARMEQWFPVQTAAAAGASSGRTTTSSTGSKRNPSVLLEICFAASERMDDSEDDMDDEDEEEESGSAAQRHGSNTEQEMKASFSKRSAMKIRNQLKQEEVEETKKRQAAAAAKQQQQAQQQQQEEPVLTPGIVNAVFTVGARDIGNQKDDDGSRGWVQSSPELVVLEQFPPNPTDSAPLLPEKVEWFCFPEGCRLWRGTTPPNHEELGLKRFSASAPAQLDVTTASFDAALQCTTSFCWFVIASNSDEYGSSVSKTFGTCIRFHVPAPTGIDPTQDDFAQTIMMGPPTTSQSQQQQQSTLIHQHPSHDNVEQQRKRLWVPIGICFISHLPIVGAMEGMLLRICEYLHAQTFHYGMRGGGANNHHRQNSSKNNNEYHMLRNLHADLEQLILHYPSPIPGVVSVSIPFGTGERFHLQLTDRSGLPALPHGNCVSAVCRLLGAEGMNFVLAALLTECKILLVSNHVANLCLVAEVMTALIYPLEWSLPYIPVLPAEMMEFIEAPLSFLLGIPACHLKQVDPAVLEDVVVVDLDRDLHDFYHHGGQSQQHQYTRVGNGRTKVPTPLPAATASSISKAVYRLLRAEEEVQDASAAAAAVAASAVSSSSLQRSFPRMEPESLVEREFRLAVALEICGLLRGYRDCTQYATASDVPVFDVDLFLQTAPALFEESSTTTGTGGASSASNSRSAATGTTAAVQQVLRRVQSPRSRRFLSCLVNCQHFHQFLDTVHDQSGNGRCAFCHEIMQVLEARAAAAAIAAGPKTERVQSMEYHKAIDQLAKSLQKLEDKIPTYRIKKADSNSAAGGRSLGRSNDHSNKAITTADETSPSPDKKKKQNRPWSLPHLSFPRDLLQQITIDSPEEEDASANATASAEGVQKISLEYLLELEKNPWRYQNLFAVLDDEGGDDNRSPLLAPAAPLKLQDAIGERRYRAWKMAMQLQQQERQLQQEQLQQQERQAANNDGQSHPPEQSLPAGADARSASMASTADLDLTALLRTSPSEGGMMDNSSNHSLHSNMDDSSTSLDHNGSAQRSGGSGSSGQSRVSDAKDREVIRRCLAGARAGSASDRDYVGQAEVALYNPSARRFLLSVLTKRNHHNSNSSNAKVVSDSGRASSRIASGGSSPAAGSSTTKTSKLDHAAFETLTRLGCAMLDACMEVRDYEAAYQLLQLTVGLYTRQTSTNNATNDPSSPPTPTSDPSTVIYMSARIGLHPIYADMGVWEYVKNIHLRARQEANKKTTTTTSSGDTAPSSSSAVSSSLRALSSLDANHNKNSANANNPRAHHDKEGGDDRDEYDAAVATLYEMLGYGIPAEELARFAAAVSQRAGWFGGGSERGQSILLLARRLCMRRDYGNEESMGNSAGAVTSGSQHHAASPHHSSQQAASTPVAYNRRNKNSDLAILSSISRRNLLASPAEPKTPLTSNSSTTAGAIECYYDDDDAWTETGWCHPAAQSARSRFGAAAQQQVSAGTPAASEPSAAGGSSSSTSTTMTYMKRSAVTSVAYLGCSVVVTGGLDGGVFMARQVLEKQHRQGGDEHDPIKEDDYDDENDPSSTDDAAATSVGVGVRGVHLDWGSSGSRYTVVGGGPSATTAAAAAGGSSAASSAQVAASLDGEYGVGAVSCLAATRGSQYSAQSYSSLSFQHHRRTGNKDVADRAGSPSAGGVQVVDKEDLLQAMEGCRVVAGTTCGDLRVWSVKDVFSAVFFSSSRQQQSEAGAVGKNLYRGDGGASSAHLRSGTGRGGSSSMDFGAGSSYTRLKFSLRGRALSGHRGGVSCIDVPSSVYRPDSIVSGGADGLIKLWSLRTPGRRSSSLTTGGDAAASSGMDGSSATARTGALSPRSGSSGGSAAARSGGSSGDALSILSGHGGRVLAVKTAWHGDRLLSGGADRTVRVWDLNYGGSAGGGGGGKCLHSLSGHFGWVTAVHYWGPNTIISASTDRSVALWDARVRNTPLFALRHHYAPITSLLVGSRTDPIMMSAAADGTVAAWDFRQLSGSTVEGATEPVRENSSHAAPGTAASSSSRGGCKIVRHPVAKLYLQDYSHLRHVCGSVLLARGTIPRKRTVLCTGSDATVREWDVQSGQVLSELYTGHADMISTFTALQGGAGAAGDAAWQQGSNNDGACAVTGTITTSWDGTVRMRTKMNKNRVVK